MKTKKTVFLISLFLIGSFLCTSCNKEDDKTEDPVNPQVTVPILTTKDASDVTNSSANVGGNITADGGEAVIERGVCYSTSSNPNIYDDLIIQSGSGTGSFECNIASLNHTTMYYYKAYAINSVGVGYGVQKSFTTSSGGGSCEGITSVNYQGQTYNTVEIGDQCWFKENLNIGTRINVSQAMQDNQIIEKYCYNDDEANCEIYGGLYQWKELNQYSSQQGSQGICPDGWHIPTDAEWKILEGTADSQFNIGSSEWDDIDWRGSDVGKNLKSTTNWDGNGNGTDVFGFGALPAGYVDYSGEFVAMGLRANFWTSNRMGGVYIDAWIRFFDYNSDKSWRAHYGYSHGFSLRCLKDSSSRLSNNNAR